MKKILLLLTCLTLSSCSALDGGSFFEVNDLSSCRDMIAVQSIDIKDNYVEISINPDFFYQIQIINSDLTQDSDKPYTAKLAKGDRLLYGNTSTFKSEIIVLELDQSSAKFQYTETEDHPSWDEPMIDTHGTCVWKK